MSQAETWGMQTASPASPTEVAVRVNASFDALKSSNSGPEAPDNYHEAGTLWLDTSDNDLYTLMVRGAAGYHLMAAFGTAGDSIAASALTEIGRSSNVHVTINGTTAITNFGVAPAHILRLVTFTGALTLTHNAVSLILPGGVNIVTAAGDVAIFVSEGSGKWRCVNYQRAADDPKSFAANGYCRFPNGLILQWGTSAPGGIAFPLAFPTACMGVQVTCAETSSATSYRGGFGSNVTAAGFTLSGRLIADGGSVAATASQFRWLAIGY